MTLAISSTYAPLVPVPKIAPRTQPPDVYARDRRAPTVCKHRYLWVRAIACERENADYGDTDVVYERNTSDMDMLPVECILKELDDVLSDGIFGCESFRPSEERARIESGLFYGEGECEGEGNVCRIGIVFEDGVVGSHVSK